MAIDSEFNINEFLSIFKRRWRLELITFLLLVPIVVVIAYLLPPVYVSEGVVSIDGPSVSKDVVQETAVANYADENIDKIRRQIMSKDNLMRISQKYQMYPDVDKKKIYGLMTSAIIIKPETRKKSTSEWDQEKVTIALNVSFEYKEAAIAYKVANDLVTSILDLNLKERKARVTETTGFLTQELDGLKSDLETVEKKVADYKQKHSDALPEHEQMYMGMLQNLEASIKEVDRDYKTAEEELRYLDVELTTTKAAQKNNANAVSGSTVSELDKAKAELERALVLYKDTHPTVRNLKRKIQTLEMASEVPADSKPVKTDITSDLAVAKIQAQIEAAKARLNSLTEQKKSMVSQMAKLQSQVVQTPQVESGLFTLLRDYENAKGKYDEVKSKLVNAKIAENLELSNKGERFTLLVSPSIPEYPIKPIKKNIIGLGILAAIGISLGLAAALDFLDPRVRGVGRLTAIVNMRPLVLLPYIPTQAELKHNNDLIRRAYIAAIFMAGILLLGAYYYFVLKPV